MKKSTQESEFDKDFLRRLRVDINAALDTVAKQHGITLKTGNCIFDLRSKNFSFKLEGVAKGGIDKRGALYNSLQDIVEGLPPLYSTHL